MEKWVHIIGICGVTTSGLAVSFKNNGWNVTGSDKGFFPPVSDYLKANDIKILPGFKKERLTIEGKHPNLVIFQGTKGRFNTEILEAKELGLKTKSYPEVLEEYFINKKNSVVITGSFGKTTTTGLVVNILKETNIKMNYMYGGLDPDFKPNLEFCADSKISIIEGDEYITSFQDNSSKFFHYHPTTVLLTGVVWDHSDIFKSEFEYIENFKKFIAIIPKTGNLIVNVNDKNSIEIAKETKANVIFYSADPENALIKPDWYLLYDSKPFPCIVKSVKEKSDLEIIPFERKIIGKINDNNILAATVLSRILDVKKVDIQKGIRDFRGIKRRMEIRFQDKNVTVIDDFGSTPGKARHALRSLKDDFPNNKIIVVFEPSAGSRTINSSGSYVKSFDDADLVFLPRFTPVGSMPQGTRFNEMDLLQVLLDYNYNAKYIGNDEILVQEIIKEIKLNKNSRHSVVLFMGSHSFRGLIKNLVMALKNGEK
jgi:UDP-N-acetylmuramate: L-alanyl-gamma-D-glutamyl-meso-diaminopimelate ligase